MGKRWNKRTENDKERIHKEKLAQEKARESKDNGRHYTELEKNMDPKRGTEVYNDGDIPIPCMDHGWVGSDKYVLLWEPDLLGRNTTFIYGNCKKCGKKTKRVIPIPFSQEGMLFSMAMFQLIREGRLTDARKPATAARTP